MRMASPRGDPTALLQAATHVADTIGSPPSGQALVIHSPGKASFAQALCSSLAQRGMAVGCHDLGPLSPEERRTLGSSLASLAAHTGLIILADPADGEFVFGYVGRPDRGLRLPVRHFFCDWTMGLEGVIRTYAVDSDELEAFRRLLLAALTDTQTIAIMSPAGTALTITPRHWNLSYGEVFTPVVEGAASGTVLVDGCAYGGPPAHPFAMRIEQGRATNLVDLDASDESQRLARADLSRDAGAAVLCEFGLGINPGALWHADLMEAEQARGTCHLGFGDNTAYGGCNASATHVDFVLRAPTIVADDRTLCEDGVYRL